MGIDYAAIAGEGRALGLFLSGVIRPDVQVDDLLGKQGYSHAAIGTIGCAGVPMHRSVVCRPRVGRSTSTTPPRHVERTRTQGVKFVRRIVCAHL